MMAEAGKEQQFVVQEKRVIKRRMRYLVAAALVAGVLVTGYLLLLNRGQDPVDKKIISVKTKTIEDIPAPSGNNAVLTLATGETIILDSVSAGQVAVQGNTRITKTADGKIIYKGNGSGEMQYNILTVPRGSQIASITLSDGTKAWLNSASALKYPVVFTGNERKVEITGEVYFEVAHNASMPFRVQKGDVLINVLGTHFNVNAYDDETAVEVTLLEGAVRINSGTVSGLLRPGQQAKVSSGIQIGDDTDLEEVMAWKNGKFQFGEAADINTIMRQVSRWYDVDVVYKGAVTGHIGGTISRYENASKVLDMLEMTGAIRFQIEGRKVIVVPK